MLMPWWRVREAVRQAKAERRVERLLARKYHEGPHFTSRAMRRAEGERGYRYGHGAMAIPRTRRSK